MAANINLTFKNKIHFCEVFFSNIFFNLIFHVKTSQENSINFLIFSTKIIFSYYVNFKLNMEKLYRNSLMLEQNNIPCNFFRK